MELTAAEQLAWNLMQEFRLSQNGWMFWWDNAKRRFGSCCTATRRITLSRELTLRNDQPQVEDTIRHEIAHALAGSRHGHDEEWKRQCAVTGANPKRCYDSAEVDAPKGDWQATCGGCGTVHSKFRRPRGIKYCAVRKCVAKFGKLKNIQMLVWKHKDAILFNPTLFATEVVGVQQIAASHLSATDEAKRAGVEHFKAQLRREQEIEEMKSKIADLESKLGRK